MAYCGNNKSFCVYKVPPYVIGWPLYSWEKVTAYVLKKLRKEGFEAHYLGENAMYISWENIAKQPDEQHEPPPSGPDLTFLDDIAGKYR
jgi:hypothetical protein